MLNGLSSHEELQRLRGLLLPGHQSVGLAAFRAFAAAAAHFGSSKAPKRAFWGPPGPLSGSPTRLVRPARDAGPRAAKSAAQEARKLLPAVYVHLKSAACKDTACIVAQRAAELRPRELQGAAAALRAGRGQQQKAKWVSFKEKFLCKM